jgi:adenylylsulfate kinase
LRQGWAVWLTGLPASGKSTIAAQLLKILAGAGVGAQVLESDAVRRVLTPAPTYSPQERETFYTSLVYIGGLLADNGVNVVFDATANRLRWRDAARLRFSSFMEVYVETPLEVCASRDPKGIYRAAASGEARYVPGAQDEYEPPTRPELKLDGRLNPAVEAERLYEEMVARGFV